MVGYFAMKKRLYIGTATYEGETENDIPHGYGYLMIKHEFDILK